MPRRRYTVDELREREWLSPGACARVFGEGEAVWRRRALDGLVFARGRETGVGERILIQTASARAFCEDEGKRFAVRRGGAGAGDDDWEERFAESRREYARRMKEAGFEVRI